MVLKSYEYHFKCIQAHSKRYLSTHSNKCMNTHTNRPTCVNGNKRTAQCLDEGDAPSSSHQAKRLPKHQQQRHEHDEASAASHPTTPFPPSGSLKYMTPDSEALVSGKVATRLQVCIRIKRTVHTFIHIHVLCVCTYLQSCIYIYIYIYIYKDRTWVRTRT
jgi:hypothetical protein